jgi:phthiocerol/phenolphthiocerol synthesis type-I polyketide synthase E
MARIPDHGSDHHIAIIGVACRLPGARDASEFWRNLLDGVESLTTFTDEELIASGVDPGLVRSPQYVKSRGIIGGADAFDAGFFGFTPREAELLDPQQRVFLECAWHALEDGGYVPGRTDARIAVYGGVGTNWHLGDISDHPDVRKFSSPASVVTSNDKDYVTTRVSYKLGLTGPSVNVQSACSTSLVAAVLGMNSLHAYQCDMVLAGGATIEMPEKKGYLYQEGGMESPDGRCRPFDAQARGTVFSRGAGVVLLKRLDEAIRDRDHIYAVIRDGAVNNDGNVKVGFTAPSVQGQVEVAVEALERAGVSADTLSFVEAHGTATSLGDPIEVTSLTQAFRHYTDARQFCALGSVKGNIGHVDVASGAAGLIKTALALETGVLPASLNYDTPNPKIDFPESPFFVNTAARTLPKAGTPRRALINSFGVGGTNACLILEEPPAMPAAPAREGNVLLLSARTPAALDSLTDRLRAHVETHPEQPLDEVAFTCQAGRREFQQRRWVPFSGREDLLARLTRGTAGMTDGVCQTEGRAVAFAFPGQGNQYLGMGRGLYDAEPVFRRTIDAGAELLAPIIGADIRDVMYAEPDPEGLAAARLNQTCFTQPAIFLTSYAMAGLWRSWGIEPAAMIGHSVGEYVAACLAGVLSFEDALRAVARRGQLIQSQPGGSMLAVLRPEADVLPYLSGAVAVAAVNGPQLTVVAGPTPDVAALEARLRAERVFSKRLDTSHAFHSPMMDAILEPFAETLAGVTLREPSRPIASTLTGTWMTAGDATSVDYWVKHVRRSVRFLDAVNTLTSGETPYIVLECGPGHSLASAVKHVIAPEGPHAIVGSMRADTDAGTDVGYLMGAIGALWGAGRAIDWGAFYREQPRRASLPGYPFERQVFALDYWRQPAAGPQARSGEKKADVGEWFYLGGWQRTLPIELLHTRELDGDEAAVAHTWLVFEDALGLWPEIERHLAARDELVIRVGAGAGFAQVDTRRFTIREGVRSDYDDLVGALKSGGIRPDRVLHLWNLEPDAGPPSFEGAERDTTRAFLSPLFVEQAFIRHNLLDDLSIIVAASHVFDVGAEGVRNPTKALALGPCRVAGKEFPMMRARFVDVAPPADDRGMRALAAQLIAEAHLRSQETVVAYRGPHRFTESFDAAPLPPAVDIRSRLRDEGVYLITGGVGGLGLFLARQIALTVERPTFVLTHRSGVPDRSAWPEWIRDHQEHDATSSRIRGILAIEEAGGTVVLARAASEDLTAMQAVVEDAERRFGRIHGVVHAAGMAGEGIISLKTEEMAREVLDPKVAGTLVLDQLFRGRGADFIVLLSSITTVLGETGRVDYCSANAFMDAMAHYHRGDPDAPFLAMNFGAWAEFGMAARWEERKAARAVARRKPGAPNGQRLQFVSREGAQAIYDVLLDPAADWVINTHFVFGNPTVVGTTFLDLVAEFIETRHPGSTPVLRNMAFVSPLMFEPGAGKRIRLLVREHEGGYRFSVRSQAASREARDVWHEHFKGDAAAAPPADVPAADIEALAARFTGEADRRPFHVNDESGETPLLELGERWNCLRELRTGTGEWLARIELGEQYESDLGEYAFHPAIMDVAMAAAVRHVADAVYLPAGYGGMTLRRRYPSRVWSHIRPGGANEPGADTIAFDITILDDEGRELASVERYTLKKVTARAAAPAAGVRGRAAAAGAARAKDVLPAEGWDAFTRILAGPPLPQVIVSTSDLYALIEDEQPESAGGKTDGEARAEKAGGYARPPLSTPYEEPANEIEKAIAGVWGGILGIEHIGVNDDFTELGGNSLLAVQAVANTADAFQVDLPVDAFYRRPTVRGLGETVVELLVSMAGEETLEDLISSLET